MINQYDMLNIDTKKRDQYKEPMPDGVRKVINSHMVSDDDP